jgi:hypothetical protein
VSSASSRPLPKKKRDVARCEPGRVEVVDHEHDAPAESSGGRNEGGAGAASNSRDVDPAALQGAHGGGYIANPAGNYPFGWQHRRQRIELLCVHLTSRQRPALAPDSAEHERA